MRNLFGVLSLILLLSQLGCKRNNCEKSLQRIVKVAKENKFVEYQEKEAIPNFIYEYLGNIYGEKFRIADAGQVCQCSDDLPSKVFDSSAISKQMVYQITDSDMINYRLGKYYVEYAKRKLLVFGIGKNVAYISFMESQPPKLVGKCYFFLFNEDKILDVWSGSVLSEITNSKQAIDYIENLCTK
jgi:hypothetical protein